MLSRHRFGCFPLLLFPSIIPSRQILLTPCDLRTAFGVTVELQDLRFNCGFKGSELCCTKKVFNSRMIRQSFVCHEPHHIMILEHD